MNTQYTLRNLVVVVFQVATPYGVLSNPSTDLHGVMKQKTYFCILLPSPTQFFQKFAFVVIIINSRSQQILMCYS